MVNELLGIQYNIAKANRTDKKVQNLESNSLLYIAELRPEVVISSGGASVKYKDQYVYTAEFTEEETNYMIKDCVENLWTRMQNDN